MAQQVISKKRKVRRVDSTCACVPGSDADAPPLPCGPTVHAIPIPHPP
jgi:hypothetical protein